MKFLLVLLIPALSAVSGQESTVCSVEDGFKLQQFAGRNLFVKVPCKYNAVLQQCGPYEVTVTPAHRYLYPTYIMDSIRLSVVNKETRQYWEGRTTNKIAALYIIKGSESGHEAFNKKEGTYNTEDLFTVTNTTKDVTLTEKTGVFSITFGPFDFNGDKNRDSTMKFVCNQPHDLIPYPTQFCGSAEGKEIKERAKELFSNKDRVDLAVMYDIFTDTSIAQVDEECIAATQIMTEQCQTDDQRKEAIKTCHLILDSAGHTRCVNNYACNPMEVFVDCMRFVCSGYHDKDACERIGQAIDMCRNFPGLTSQVKEHNCYKDLLTAEDNPYYNLAE